MAILTTAQIRHGLRHYSGWKISSALLSKEYTFNDFTEASKFVAKIAPLADELNHHPSVTMNYNAVRLELSSHDEGGVTDRDIELAHVIERAEDE